MGETSEKRAMHRHGSLLRLPKVLMLLAMMALMLAGFSVTAYARDKDIVILYTNDVHCGVEDNIGYAGLALYKKQMQAQTPYVALVDAGDAIQGAPIGTLSEGGYITELMNQVGYDFAIPGNHEFDYGMSRFLELSKKLNCGYYSANFMDLKTNQLVFPAYKLFDFGDTKLAFVGASTPETFTKSTPKYFQDENGTYIYGFGEDESGEKLYAQIQSAVDAARAAGADTVVLVGHLGNEGITERWSSKAIIANTTGIDAVIDGHSHETVSAVSYPNKDGKQIISTQTGTKLANIGKMTIKPNGEISTELVDHVSADGAAKGYIVKNGDSLSRIAKRELGSYDLWNVIYNANLNKIQNPNKIRVGTELVIPTTAATSTDGKAGDPATQKVIDRIKSEYEASLAVVLGHSDVELTVNDGNGVRRVRNGETNLGDLTADAYRYVLGADIGFSNGGGIRSSIAAGDITYNDTLKVFPFGNMGCVVEVTGQQVKDALEMGAMNYPEESGGFLQVSGVTYTIDSSIPSKVKLDDKRNFIGVDGAYRVTDIKVNGEPLDLTKTYTVASHNYMLKNSGDGMTMFDGAKVVQDEVMSDVDLLSKYIRDNLGGNVGAAYANPEGEGRITVK